MEAERRRRTRVRNPLSDCTNTVNSSQSSSSSKKGFSLLPKSRKSARKSALSSAINKFLANANANANANAKSAKSPAESDGAGGSAADPPPPVEATPLRRPQRPFSALGKGEGIEPCSVYTRRQSAEKMKSTAMANEELLSNMPTSEKRKSKGKEINEPSSCPPATKIQKIGKDDELNILPKACTALRKKKQGHRPSRKDSDKLSQDYIEQQRAYFAEIDAFELSEEEVESVSDLD